MMSLRNFFLGRTLVLTLLLTTLSLVALQAQNQDAYFAAGCFWCTEEVFQDLKGVKSAVSGYMGLDDRQPTYKQVSRGGTGFLEALHVVYDPKVISFEKLLDYFWVNVDPLQGNGQFCDIGDSYKSAIYYANDEEKRAIQASQERAKRAIREKNRPFQTGIFAVQNFFPAEDYHQDYYQRNPARYKYYKTGCGRPARLKQLWGKKKSL